MSEDKNEESPVFIFLSGDGRSSFYKLQNEEDDESSHFQEALETNTNDTSLDEAPSVFLQIEKTETDKAETFVNIDVKSDLLEGYMEKCFVYRCTECTYVSEDQKECHQHCLGHLLKKKYPSCAAQMYFCGGCSETFSSDDDLKVHMQQEHKADCASGSDSVHVKTINVSIEKSACDVKRKTSRVGERKPMDTVKKPTALTYVCIEKHCGCKFSSEQFLKIHQKCHISLNMDVEQRALYQCFQCSILFNDWQTCSSHLYKTHDVDCGLLRCPVCMTYRTTIPLRLENHMRIHSDVRAFTCKHCGKTFKQASQLRNHKVTHIDKDSNTKPTWSTSKQCNMCFKMYADSKILKKHKEEVHSKLRPFVCNICGHASARKSMLKMHQRQHTGQKPFQCHMCPYTTADHNSLRKHIMRHTGVRPYKCAYCPYTAIQSGSFKNHMRTMHFEKENSLYACKMCPYKTISEDNHVRHISDHLTGLIRDQGAGAEQATTKDRATALFQEQHEEVVELDQAAVVQAEDVVDTGGITIPAEPLMDDLNHIEQP